MVSRELWFAAGGVSISHTRRLRAREFKWVSQNCLAHWWQNITLQPRYLIPCREPFVTPQYASQIVGLPKLRPCARSWRWELPDTERPSRIPLPWYGIRCWIRRCSFASISLNERSCIYLWMNELWWYLQHAPKLVDKAAASTKWHSSRILKGALSTWKVRLS